jgi:hypothetical protein
VSHFDLSGSSLYQVFLHSYQCFFFHHSRHTPGFQVSLKAVLTTPARHDDSQRQCIIVPHEALAGRIVEPLP